MRLNLLRNSIAIISFIAFTSFTIVPNEGPKSYSSINDAMEPKATPLYAPPTFSGCPPTDVTVNYSPGLCGATVNWTPPVASSDATSVVSNYAPGDSFLPGTTAVIYRATNAIGEVGICAFNVIVEDNEIPIINDCPVDIVVQADPTTCSQVVTWTRPNSVTDNCPAGEGISPVLQDFESTQNQCYVFDQTSISGTGEVNGSRNLRTNFLSSLFPTSFTTPLIYFNGNGEVSFSHNISSVGNNATIFVTMISEGGTRTNIFTEVYSNTVTQTEYIPVTLPAGNYRLEISYSSTAFFDFSQTAFLDDLLIPGTVVTNTNDPSCDRANFIVRRADGTGLNSGDAFPIGVTTIIYDVLDSAKPTENRGVCSFTITVENDIDPPVVVGASPVLYCENDPIPQLEVTVGPGETVDWYTTSTGGIPIIPGGTNTTTYTPTSPGFYYAETRNTSTGCISDTRTEIQVIEVPLPPAPPAPTPIEYCVGDTASQLTATVFPDHTLLWYPVSTGGTSNTTAPTPTTTVADVGSTFFYVSQRSNTTGCESDRTEIEVIVYNLPLAPTVNSPQQFCVGDVASTLDSYVTSGTNLVWYDAAVGGNVIPGTTTPNTASATTAPHQQYWVTQSAINGSANCESTRTRLQVIVNDAPTITSDPTNQAICPGANATFTAAAANAASLQWQLFDGTSWNDLTNTPPHSGVTTTTLTVTNATIPLNGNRYRIIASSAAVSCSDAISSEAVLTVEDNSNPVITGCPAGPITASSGSGNCGAAVTWTPPSVNDDCGTATLTTNNYNPGDTFLPGTTTVIYTATDLAGNTATCSFDVIVTDDEDPVISGPSDITVPADNVGCTAIVNYAAPTATDNCAAGDGTFPVFTDFEVANRNVLANDCWVFAGTDVSTSSPLSGATSMRTSEVEPAFTRVLVSPLSYFNGTGEISFVHALQAFPSDITQINVFLEDESANITPIFNYTYSDLDVQSANIPITQTGNYTVRFEFTTDVKRNTSKRIRIDNLLIPGVKISDPSNGCAASTLQVVQTAGLGSGATYPLGTTTNTFETTDAYGNTQTFSFNVTVENSFTVTANATATEICLGDSVTLTGSGGLSYTWDNGVTDGVAFAPTTTTTYTVTGTDANGCQDTDTITVTVNPLPTVTANATATTICEGDSVTLTGSGANTYTWDNGVTDGVAFAPTTTTTYTVTGTNGNGCQDTDTITITVNPLPTISVTGAPSCSTDLSTYALGVSVNSGTLTSTEGTVVNTGGNNWTISGITAGNDIILTVTDSNSCINTLNITAPDCSCPVINAPSIVQGDQSYCIGNTVPTMEVSVGAGETVDWFTQATGGTPILTGNTTLQPTEPSLSTGANNFFAETRNTTTGCTSATRTQIVITQNPLPTVTANTTQTVICEGDSVTLTGGGANTYTWDNGVTDGVAFAPTSTTTYTVTGTDANGCQDTDTITVTVNPLPTVTANATATTICEGDSVTLTGSGTNTYTWDNGVADGVAFAPTTTTTYTVTGTDANGCQDTDTITITVNPAPTVTANTTSASICIGDSVTLTGAGANTYTWDNGVVDGVAFAPTTTTTYTVTGTDANGCQDTDTITITVNPLPTVTANATALTICEGESVTLTGSGANTYTWDNGVVDGVAFAPTTTTTYTVTGTDANGCQDTDTLTITVNPAPTVVANASQTTICVGENITLTGSGASTYTWDNGVTNGVAFAPTTTTTYTVTGTAVNGCLDTDTITITVNPLPTISANATNTSICIGESVTLTGSGANTYTWDNGVADGVAFAPTTTTTYTVTGTDANGCQDTDTITITVNPLPTISVTMAPACSADLSTYDLGVTVSSGTVTSTEGTVVNTGGNNWTISGITSGNNIVLTVTDSNSCADTLSITAPNCACPLVNAPAIVQGDQAYCIGNTVPTMEVSVGANETVDWFTQATGGVAISTGSLTHQPIAASLGNGANDFFAETRNTVNGCISSSRTQITITQNPLPTVTANTTQTIICEGDSVTLSGSGADSYTWDNGITDAVAFVPTATTTYTVTGTDINGCQNTDTITITVNPLPTVTANATQTTICVGESITLTGSGANSYTWDNGVTDGITFAPTATTTYTVTGTDANGCQNTDAITITVNPLPTFTVTSGPNCAPDLLTYSITIETDGDAVTTDVPAATVTDNGSNSWTISNIPDGTNITVTSTNTTTSCDTGQSFTAPSCACPMVNAPAIVQGNQNYCIGSVVPTMEVSIGVDETVDWYTVAVGGTAALTGSLTFQPLEADLSNGPNDFFAETRNTVNGCISSTRTQITITQNPLPTVTANTTQTVICEGDSVTLTGAGANTYTWDSGVTDGIAFAPTATATYTVTGTDTNGCQNTDTITITVNPLPNVVANATNIAICLGDSVTLSGSGADSYSWDNGVTDGVAFAPATTTIYTVTGTDVNGCQNTDAITITVNPLPNVVANATATSINAGEPVTLTGSGAVSYVWDNGVTDGDTVFPLVTTTYTIVGTDANGCQNTDMITITVAPTSDLRLEKIVDNASPNVGDIVTFTLTIFNDGPTADAGGTIVNDIMPSGYTYVGDDGNATNGTYNNGTGDWVLPSVSNGGSVSLQITATVDAPTGTAGEYNNIAQVTFSNNFDPDSTPNNDDGDQSEDDESSISIIPQVTDLEVVNTISASDANPGDVLVLTVEVLNNGTHDATNVTIDNIVPIGFTVTSINNGGVQAGNTISWSGMNIPNGTSSIVTFEVSVNIPTSTADEYLNTVQVMQVDQFDPDSTPNNDDGDQSEDDEDNAMIILIPADIILTKALSASSNANPNAGDTVTFEVTVTNDGPGLATNVGIEDIIPSGFLLGNVNNGGTVSGNTIRWTIPSLPVGSQVLTYDVTINAPANVLDEYRNIAQVTASDQFDPDSTPNNDDGDQSEDDEASYTIPSPTVDIEIIKTVDKAETFFGDTVVFTITATNNSIYDATNVGIEDALPSGYSFETASADLGVYDDAIATWEIPLISSGATATLEITVTVTDINDYTNVAELIFVDQIDPNMSNDRDEATPVVTQSQCLTVFNEFSPNDDGLNDVFFIECIDQFPNNFLQVFNRWGNIVFEMRGYDNSWGGISTGRATLNADEKLPVGTYYYLLELGDGATPTKTGWLYISR